MEFPGHEVHVSIDVALVAPENVLDGQEEHIDEPITSLYFPIAHAEQDTRPGGPPVNPCGDNSVNERWFNPPLAGLI